METSFKVHTKLASLFFKEMKKPLVEYSLMEKENLIFIPHDHAEPYSF